MDGIPNPRTRKAARLIGCLAVLATVTSPRLAAAAPVSGAVPGTYPAFARAVRDLPRLLETGQTRAAADRLRPWASLPETSGRVALLWYLFLPGERPPSGAAFTLGAEAVRLSFGEAPRDGTAAVTRLLETYPAHFVWRCSNEAYLDPAWQAGLSAALGPALGRAPDNPFLGLARQALSSGASGRLPGTLDDPRDLDCLLETGRLRFLRGDTDGALRLWRQAASLATRADDRWLEIEAGTLRAQALIAGDRLDEAHEACRQTDRLLQTFPSPWLRAHLDFARGMLLASRGELREAVVVFRGIARAPGERGYARLRNASLANLAYLYDETGDYALALACHDEVIRDTRTALVPRARAVNLLNRGALHERLGMPESALADYRRAIELDPEHVPEEIRALGTLNMGNVYARGEQWDQALACYGRAGAAFEALGLPESALLVALNRVAALLGRGDLPAAGAGLAEVARELKSPGNARLLPLYHFLDCCRLLEASRYPEAASALTRLESVLPGGPEGSLRWEVPLLRGKLLAGTGRVTEALAALSRSASAFDALQDRCGGEETQIRFGGTGRELVEALLDALASAGPGELREETRLQFVLDAMEWYRGRVLRKRLEAGRPAASPEDRILLAEVRTLLSHRRAVALVFFQGTRRLYYLAVGGWGAGALFGSLEAGPGGPERSAEAAPPEAAEFGGRGPGTLQGGSPWAVRLREFLASPPVLRLLDSAEEVVVLPDGELHAFPLESVQLPVGGRREYLGLYRPLCYLPSWRPVLRAGGGEGNPATFDYCGLFAAGSAGDAWPDLPFARAEVRNAALDGPWTAPRVVHGPWAGTTGAGRLLGRRETGVFHVAAHIEADEENPWASRVILGGTESGPTVVTVRDLEALEIRARLVVLSGCRSGRGRVFPGEGNVSLARVFLASGSRGVLTTEHEVEDRFCALFMGRFFACLEESGGDAVRALHRARRDLSAEPAWRDPSHWANYRIYGIPGRVPLRARLPLPSICVILGVLFAAPLLVRAVKRRRP